MFGALASWSSAPGHIIDRRLFVPHGRLLSQYELRELSAEFEQPRRLHVEAWAGLFCPEKLSEYRKSSDLE